MVENYVSPACYVTEIELEGVLCLSDANGSFVHNGVSGDDTELFDL